MSHETVGQPDVEPEVESHNSNQSLDGVNIPVPDVLDDELICDALVSTDLEEDACVDSRHDLAWKAEIFITEDEWNASVSSLGTLDSDALIAATSKKQHTEVKLHQLTAQEKLEVEEAKRKEIDSWLKTNTVQRILRKKLSPKQVLRCRWILTWTALDEVDQKNHPQKKSHKAKAHPVVLGYLDPDLENIPQDSPTLGRQ